MNEAMTSQIDEHSIRAYRLRRVREQLSAHGCAAAVLFDPINIRYATGSTNMQVWMLHNPARYVFVPVAGPVVLFEFHGAEHLCKDLETVDEVRPATPWFFFAVGSNIVERAEAWASEIHDLIRQHCGAERRLAVDRLDPAGAWALTARGITLADGQEPLERARMIKSHEELAAMRVAMSVCDEGIRRMREALRPGISENALWSILHQTNIELGGEWIETRLLASGPRTNPWYQECSARVIEAGDIVSFDTDLIGPYGFGADISRAWLCGDGEPSAEQRRLYAAAYEQIQFNAALLRPGATIREISTASYRLPTDLAPNRYGGIFHGIGLGDEQPHCVPPDALGRDDFDLELQSNMTVCLEAYAGVPGGREGIKLEQQVVITDRGPRALTATPFEVHWLS